VTHDPQNVVLACLPAHWADLMEPRILEANRYLHEHPLYNSLQQTTDCAPRTISDFMSEEEWQKRGFARVMMTPLGIADTMIFRLTTSNSAMIFMCVNRAAWGFSARDRQIADLLRSHFAAAYDNAVAFTHAQALALFSSPPGDITKAGVVSIDENGQILHTNEPAVRLIRKYFVSGSTGRSLPAPVQNWLSRDGSMGLPASTLEEVSGENRLSIRWSQQRNGSKILLLEEHPVKAGPELPSAGLSRREAEVLRWIAEGKTNVEIGRILSISVRTVEKHVEIVYRKLGVENRMGAVLRVLSRDGHS
jgi:DNA-binding CsgD family transcriptional regulator